MSVAAVPGQAPLFFADQPSIPKLSTVQRQLEAIWKEARDGVPYVHQGAKDTVALKKLLATTTVDDILWAWRHGLAESNSFFRVSSVAQLAQKFNAIVDRALHVKRATANDVEQGRRYGEEFYER